MMLDHQIDLTAVSRVRALPSGATGRAGWAIWPAAVAALLGWAALAAAEPTRPDFATVAQAIVGHLQSQPGYRPGDLLSQTQVAAALAVAAGVGWDVPQPESIISRALPDDSFLVREFSTPAGRRFMRKIAKQPGAYPRTDRLSTIAGGEAAIRILIRDPGGDKMIEYMATTRGGRNLGKMMAGAQRGVDLNKPTGRIYTADDLLVALKMLYDNAGPPN